MASVELKGHLNLLSRLTAYERDGMFLHNVEQLDYLRAQLPTQCHDKSSSYKCEIYSKQRIAEERKAVRSTEQDEQTNPTKLVSKRRNQDIETTPYNIPFLLHWSEEYGGKKLQISEERKSGYRDHPIQHAFFP